MEENVNTFKLGLLGVCPMWNALDRMHLDISFKVYSMGRYVVYISHWMERNMISYHPFSDI